jgi:hypothetical protein
MVDERMLYFFLPIYTAYLTLEGQGNAYYWYNDRYKQFETIYDRWECNREKTIVSILNHYLTDRRYINIFTYNINKIVSMVFNQYADKKSHGMLMRRIFLNIFFFFSMWFISCVYLYSYGTLIFSWQA